MDSADNLLNMKCPAKDLEKYAEKAEGWNIAPDNYEELSFFRKTDGDGWFCFMSLQPLMPLNIESDSVEGSR